jgi:hypothetical protein
VLAIPREVANAPQVILWRAFGTCSMAMSGTDAEPGQFNRPDPSVKILANVAVQNFDRGGPSQAKRQFNCLPLSLAAESPRPR